MERVDAIKKLGKILGKRFGYRVDPKAPSADERAEARQRLPALVETRRAAEAAMTERRNAVLQADQQYQQLVEAYKDARKRANEVSAKTHHFKFTVGVSNDLFFSVHAQGDSWEDVIRQVSKKSA